MGTTYYTNRIGNGNLPSSQRTIDPSFDTAAFAVPAQSTIGNPGPRHSVRPPNFGAPNGTLNNPQVGAITSAADPRRVQMGAKLVF